MSQKVTARFYVSLITDFGNSDQCQVTLLPAYADGGPRVISTSPHVPVQLPGASRK